MAAFRRKPKQSVEQPRERQRVRPQADEPRATAFSYYSSRLQESSTTAEQPRERPRRRIAVLDRVPGVGKIAPRMGFVPFVLLLVVIVAILAKLLYLGTNPRVVVIASTAAANNTLRDTNAYAQAAQKALKSSMLNRTKFTVDNSGVAQQVLQQFPELEAVSISTQFLSNRPIVNVVPAQPKLLLQSGSATFAINADGVAYGVNNGAQQNVVTVIDESGVIPVVGKQALPSGTVAFIQMVTYQMRHGGLSITSFTLPKSSAFELDMRLKGKAYIVRLNLEADARQQSGALLATLPHLGTTTPSQYIDVRTPGRIYYK